MARNILSLDSSILYRSSQKHFDRIFERYGLGYASALFLTIIYEDEGITMNEVAISGSFDKGTITKSIQKLQEQGLVEVRISTEDKRQKKLYTTAKAHEIMTDIYLQKQAWWDYLLQDVDDTELDEYLRVSAKIMARAKEYDKKEESEADVKFFGLQKVTLLDYPGNVASTLFTGGCNFRCPFCQNRSLVFLDEGNTELDKDEILSYLKERSKILDGICISGGEPLIHKGLKSFIFKVKELGLKVKLDTNGSFFEELKDLIDEGIIDHVAMDVKNAKEAYAMTIGLKEYDLTNIEKSVDLLKEGRVDYEFRTTIVREFHDLDRIRELGEWLKGAKRLYLQNFEDGPTCIMQGLHQVDKEMMYEMRDILRTYVPNTDIRGME